MYTIDIEPFDLPGERFTDVICWRVELYRETIIDKRDYCTSKLIEANEEDEEIKKAMQKWSDDSHTYDIITARRKAVVAVDLQLMKHGYYRVVIEYRGHADYMAYYFQLLDVAKDFQQKIMKWAWPDEDIDLTMP